MNRPIGIISYHMGWGGALAGSTLASRSSSFKQAYSSSTHLLILRRLRSNWRRRKSIDSSGDRHTPGVVCFSLAEVRIPCPGAGTDLRCGTSR